MKRGLVLGAGYVLIGWLLFVAAMFAAGVGHGSFALLGVWMVAMLPGSLLFLAVMFLMSLLSGGGPSFPEATAFVLSFGVPVLNSGGMPAGFRNPLNLCTVCTGGLNML